MNKIIDCKGMNCPIPVINTKKYFDSIQNGTATIIVDNEVAKNNIIKYAKNNEFDYKAEDKEELFYITISKDNTKCPVEMVDNQNNRPFTIVVGSDKLGEGSDELGIALMKSYLFALSEADVIPDNLLFVNGGVKLVVEEAPTLESIQKLKERGTVIQSCGLCLDFYKLKEKLAVGEITNMYAIIEKMNESRTIKL